METANDKKFSDARWQALGAKLLEPTITNVLLLGKVLSIEKGNFLCFINYAVHKSKVAF